MSSPSLSAVPRSDPLRPLWALLAVALGLRLIMAWANYGFVAMDDYREVLALAVPAQRAPDPETIIRESSIRSPVPRLFVHGLGRTALALGLTDALSQVRFVYAALGVFSVTVVAAVWWMFAVVDRVAWGHHAAAWTGAHFLAVYLTTRTLLENLALPFVTVSAALLVAYHARGRRGLLLGAVTALAIASMFRFQAGVAIVVIAAVPIAHRAWRDLAALAAAGVALFAATGAIDLLLRGSFHESLRAYFSYNLAASSTFGTSPWYGYLLLLAAASLPPLLVSRYRGFPWRDYAGRLWPLIAFVAVFVAAHSAVPHKEDRFMVPILGAYFALLAPLSAHLYSAAPRSWRTVGFLGVNAIGFILLAAVPAQNNVIGPVRYLAGHPEIQRVWSVGESVEPYPTAYSDRVLPELREVAEVPRDSIAAEGCRDAVLVRADLLPLHRHALAGFRDAADYAPGLPERLVILINPENNRRRNAVHLFLPAGCPVDG